MSGSLRPARLSRVDLAAGRAAEALLDVVTVGLEVQSRQGFHDRPLRGAEVPQGDEMVGERSRLVAGPGVERGDKLGLLDQAGLQGEEAE
jgi:hypothetical protein